MCVACLQGCAYATLTALWAGIRGENTEWAAPLWSIYFVTVRSPFPWFSLVFPGHPSSVPSRLKDDASEAIAQAGHVCPASLPVIVFQLFTLVMSCPSAAVSCTLASISVASIPLTTVDNVDFLAKLLVFLSLSGSVQWEKAWKSLLSIYFKNPH